MSIDMTAGHTRRAMLIAACGGVAAAVSGVFGRAVPVGAADSDPLLLGEENTSTNATSVTRVGSGPALVANGSGPGIGVTGTSETGIAVYGITESGHGVIGSSVTGSGVEAISPSGIALRVRTGRVRADGISGMARIPRGESVVIVQPAATVAQDAFVLLSPMSSLSGRDLWFTRQAERGTFRIQVSTPTDEDTFIGWFLMG